jgi:protein-L-isoaspartate(D-aspartate) O-methyltransferase
MCYQSNETNPCCISKKDERMTNSLDNLNQNDTPVWSISSARHKMIEQQIRPWGISETKYLDALEIVKRELFVDESLVPLVFSDLQLPIHSTQEVMMEPKVEIRVLQALAPTGKDEVLEVGTGSGYMAALLGYFSKTVKTVDIHPELVDFALSNLNKCRIPNVRAEVGDAVKGWNIESNQSFDVICVSGAVVTISEGLKSQLKIGGRLFAFVGQAPLMSATLVKRISHDYFQSQVLFETLVPMLQVDQAELSTFEF